MVHVMKRDFYINGIVFPIVFLGYPLIYLTQVSPVLALIGIIFGFTFNCFYYDNQNQVEILFVSMPVNKKKIVFTRYLFLFIIAMVFLLYAWFVDNLVHATYPAFSNWLPTIQQEPMKFNSLLFTYIGFMVFIALTVPIYYLVKSFSKALLVQGVLLFIGTIVMITVGENPELITKTFLSIIITVIEFQPTLIALAFSVGCLYISYQLSAWYFAKKDLI